MISPRHVLVSLALVGCSHSPPATPALYGPPPTSAPAAAASAPEAAVGVLRIDGASTQCRQLVSVEPDGGVTAMCMFTREEACAIRTLGPDGEERGRSELVPGECVAWAPHAGGGYLITSRRATRDELSIAALDRAGKRTASTTLSAGTLYVWDARATAGGDLVAAFGVSGELQLRGKRLAKADRTVAGLVRLPPALDHAVWSQLFTTRTTEVRAVLPDRGADFAAVIATRGPLVPDGPVLPEDDTTIYGGQTYGWRTEHVTFDARNQVMGRRELSTGAQPPVMRAVATDAGLATLEGSGGKRRVRLYGERGASDLFSTDATTIYAVNGRAWAVDCPADLASRVGCLAREIGGARTEITLLQHLRGASQGAPRKFEWEQIAALGDRVVGVGFGESPEDGTLASLTTLARAAGGRVDPVLLSAVDRVTHAPGCTGPWDLGPADAGNPADRDADLARVVEAQRAAIAACGVPAASKGRLRLHPDGGIRALWAHTTTGGKYKPLSTKVGACVRAVLEPALRCPLSTWDRTDVELSLRP